MYKSLEIIFWVALVLPIYSYILYPLILYVLSSQDKSIIKITGCNTESDDCFPLSVGVVIAAFNEEAHIKARLENLLSLEYPKDKIKFYIGTDGCDDKTDEIIQSFSNKLIVHMPFSERRGKASVLNDVVSKVKEEIIVFSDANTLFKADAVKHLTQNFDNDLVGGVCGELEILSSKTNDNLDSIYWRYERFIKVREGNINAVLGANGAIYAIRNNLFQPMPANTITDDFYMGMMIVKKGFWFLYQSNAVALEYEPDSQSDEFRRRVRIGMGNYQAFCRLAYFLNPFGNLRYFFTYFSHKVIRWFTPHLMLVILICSALLSGQPMFLMVFLAQIMLYLFCWFAYKKIAIKRLPRILSLIVFFVSMNVALFFGSIKFLLQKANPVWQRTSR